MEICEEQVKSLFLHEMEKTAQMNVLVVDDEPLIRQTVKEVLGDAGYAVDEAGDSSACLKKLASRKTDIVLMDIQMPGTDGLTTMKKLVQDNYGVDVIMISGHGSIQTAVEAVKYGALDFIEKPFSMERLRSTVDAVAQKRRQAGQMEKIREKEESVGGYVMKGKIASGAFSTVYCAVKKSLDKPVALKVLHPHITGMDPSFTARFEQEARFTAGLSHPNIVQVFDFGRDRGMVYIAMERVDGVPLKSYTSRGVRFPLGIAASLCIKVAMALGHAHEKGIVHRDVKPSNILIAKNGAVKLIDFGISRSLDAGARDLTQADQMVGTPLFMSPEQIRGRAAGPPADFFSLGILLYLLTTRVYPFNGSTLPAIVAAIAEGQYRDPGRLAPGLGHDVCGIIRKCLAKSPSKRYAAAGELIGALESAVRFEVGLNLDRAIEEFFGNLTE
jgi:CheY-like chemotaxis protein/tRNA A-37 threonylcarbamoyl transferase component Bud32